MLHKVRLSLIPNTPASTGRLSFEDNASTTRHDLFAKKESA
jgi:hypothetical protein